MGSRLRSVRTDIALGAVLIAASLAACSGTSAPEPAINPNVPPANYKAEILASVHGSLDDPTGIRDAFIAEPALKPSGRETRYIVCLRFNAKGNDGQYSGIKERAAFFYAGRLTTISDATKEQCGGVAYQPFPELQKLCREVVCSGAR